VRSPTPKKSDTRRAMRRRSTWMAMAVVLGLSGLAAQARGDCCEYQGACYNPPILHYCTQYGPSIVVGGECTCGTAPFCFGTCVAPPTPTPSPTTTPTATATPLNPGDPCTDPSQCNPQFCEGGVCCNRACTLPNESCTAPGRPGLCIVTGASVPAVSSRGLVALGVALGGVALVLLSRRASGSSGS